MVLYWWEPEPWFNGFHLSPCTFRCPACPNLNKATFDVALSLDGCLHLQHLNHWKSMKISWFNTNMVPTLGILTPSNINPWKSWLYPPTFPVAPDLCSDFGPQAWSGVSDCFSMAVSIPLIEKASARRRIFSAGDKQPTFNCQPPWETWKSRTVLVCSGPSNASLLIRELTCFTDRCQGSKEPATCNAAEIERVIMAGLFELPIPGHES